MDTLRTGIIGLGHAGSRYAQILLQGRIRGAALKAVCTRTAAKLEMYPASVAKFCSREHLLSSGTVDAVIIATPHLDHVPTGIAALNAGLHVMIEKPIGVKLTDARRLIAAHKNPRQVFAAMFNLRADPVYVRINKIVKRGELGRLYRINGTFTQWFRSQDYYNASSWRGTWRGEGGGILANQAPHQLDLIQWMAGIPTRVSAFCRFGKHHHIEVEDEVSAYMEYPGGCTASLVFSTGELPGVNRWELVGTKGSLILNDRVLCHTRKDKPRRRILNMPEQAQPYHVLIQNFVNAIQKKEKLIAPAQEGLASLEMANAMLLSAIQQRPVTIPLNTRAFARAFNNLLRKGAPQQ